MLVSTGDEAFVGQDVDIRCVRRTPINLTLRNRYGYLIWGNSLRDERRLIYRSGFHLRRHHQRNPALLMPGFHSICSQRIIINVAEKTFRHYSRFRIARPRIPAEETQPAGTVLNSNS